MERNGKQPAGAAGSTDTSPTRLDNPSPTSAQQTRPASPTLKYHLPQDLDATSLPTFLQNTSAESKIWGSGNRRRFGLNDPANDPAHQERVLGLCHEMAIQDPELDELKLPPNLVLKEGRLDRPGPIGSRPRPVYLLLRNLPVKWTQHDLDMILFGFNVISHSELLPPEQSPDNGYRAALLTITSDQATGEVRTRLQGKPAPGSDKAMDLILVDKSDSLGSSPTSRRTPESNPESTSSAQRRATREKYGTDQQFVDRFYNVYNDPDVASRARTNYAASIRVAPHQVDAYSQRAALEQDTPWPPRSFPSTGGDQGFDINSQRRATAPAVPVDLLQALTLETSYAHTRQNGSASAHPGVISPQTNGMGGSSTWNQPQQYHQHQHHPQQMGQHSAPTANPADQNPPCNTLYVGNLPMNTSEEELKATFSKQRGYKRLCYRTKNNGPMCFVEFEDTTCATRVLKLLYGHMLTNSTKGGIRLSFSKNPLGVRSQHNQAHTAHSNGYGSGMNGATNGFRTAAGPPPGLSAPPGLAPPQQANGHGNGQNGSQSGPNGQNGYTNGFSNGKSNGYSPNVYGSGGYSNGFNGFNPFLGNGYPNGRPWG